MLSVLLNINQGAKARTDALLQWLIPLQADLFVLPGWKDHRYGHSLVKTLQAWGYSSTSAASAKKSKGLLVAAKDAFHTRRITPAGTESELFVIDFASGLRLLGAYFPQGKAKEPFFAACMTEAQSARDRPFLLLGDFNTGRNELDA